MKTLLELEDRDCRFPFGDQTIVFCGDPAQDRSSYCSMHHAICWERPKPNAPKARVYHGTDFAV